MRQHIHQLIKQILCYNKFTCPKCKTVESNKFGYEVGYYIRKQRLCRNCFTLQMLNETDQ